MADVPRPPVMLPPKPASAQRDHSDHGEAAEKIEFLPFLMAVLVAAASLALMDGRRLRF